MAARCGTAVDSDPHRVQDTAGPSSSIVTVGLPGTVVGNIKISSGQLTVPGCSTSDRFGLVLFHSGFSGRKEYYRDYATALASSGWAVLQYDLDCFHVPFGGPCPQLQDIMDEVHALPHVLSWARQQAAAADPAAAERIEWTDIVVGGHSRGAEVAARTAARFPAHGQAVPLPKEFPNGTPAAHLDTACVRGCEERQLRVQAVLLVDPVAKQPATVPLINPQQPFYAIVGRGSRWCAPQRLGANNFIPSAAPPLTQAVHIPQAGHAQFWHAPAHWQAGYDLLCGTGTQPDATIRAWTARLLADWLLQALPPRLDEETVAQARDDNERWFAARVKAGDFEAWHRS